MDASGVCGLKIAWTRSDAAYVCLAKKSEAKMNVAQSGTKSKICLPKH
jgi:hypothetical protein